MARCLEHYTPGCVFGNDAIGRTDTKVNAQATIVSAEDGIVSYSWGATDTDAAGLYMAEWEVTFAGGIPMTFPRNGNLCVNVEPDLG